MVEKVSKRKIVEFYVGEEKRELSLYKFGKLPATFKDSVIFDCGKYGKMTVLDAMEITGFTKRVIRHSFVGMYTIETDREGFLDRLLKKYDCGKYGYLTLKEVKDKIGYIDKNKMPKMLRELNGFTNAHHMHDTYAATIDYSLLEEYIDEKTYVPEPKEPIEYDCGKYGILTVKEAAYKANVSMATIHNRAEKQLASNGKMTKEEIIDGYNSMRQLNKPAGTLDCGKYGYLTAEEIMKMTGMDLIDYSNRILDGATKEEIIEGK